MKDERSEDEPAVGETSQDKSKKNEGVLAELSSILAVKAERIRLKRRQDAQMTPQLPSDGSVTHSKSQPLNTLCVSRFGLFEIFYLNLVRVGCYGHHDNQKILIPKPAATPLTLNLDPFPDL